MYNLYPTRSMLERTPNDQALQRTPALEDDEFRQNVQRNLASQLQLLSKQCREACERLSRFYARAVSRVLPRYVFVEL